MDSNPTEEDLESGEETGMDISYAPEVAQGNDIPQPDENDHSLESGEASAEEGECPQIDVKFVTSANTPPKRTTKKTRKGSLADDERSQTPLQDEPDAVVGGLAATSLSDTKVASVNSELENNGREYQNGVKKSQSVDKKIAPGGGDCVAIGTRRRRTSINEDHVELDYEEEEPMVEDGKAVEKEKGMEDGCVKEDEDKLNNKGDGLKAADKEEKVYA